jgi:hypothetical protein
MQEEGMDSSRARRRVRVLVLACALAAPGASASEAYVDEVLRALERKGLLTAQEVHDIKLRARQHDLHGAPEAPEEPPSVEAPATPVQGPSVALWGRLQPRFTRIPTQDGRAGTTAFTFRRARLGARGAMNEDVAFYVQYEAANEVPGLSNAQNLLDAWIRFGAFGGSVGDLVVGQQFIPGYGRAPQLSASVERKFPEFLSPGVAGLARGLTLRRGRFGLPETATDGLLGDRLQYGLGVFNGPDLGVNNDNNDLLYAASLALTPLGATVGDEYSRGGLPLRYMLALAYARSRDRGSVDAEFQEAAIGEELTLDDRWYGVFGEGHAGPWFAWASATLFESRAEDVRLLDARGRRDDRLLSRAWAAGISRTFALNRSAQRVGVGVQAQWVDNEHPSRTRFFRTLTGTSRRELARGMDEGANYQLMLTWLVSAEMRWINEFSWYDPVREARYGAWISQFQIDF